jgi:4-diphosphocytidyl-2-C-methyl-D-erythritol kinase
LDNDSCFRGCLEARAKLNLSLRVLGRRPDGMHELSSVMTTLSLADKLSFELCKLPLRDDARHSVARESKRPPWRIDADVQSIPSGEANICFRAAELFSEHMGIDPFSISLSIFIEKRIPDAAGLGGGSADAAAVLRFLFQNRERFCRWFGLDATSVSLRELEQIALRCGADVPFCLYGGMRLCEGVGEVMTPLPSLFPAAVLLATPAQFVKTKTAFEMLDQFRETDGGAESVQVETRSREDTSSVPLNMRAGSPRSESVAIWKEAIDRQSLRVMEPLIHNDFVPVIAGALGQVEDLLGALRSTPASVVSMSGSGPTCFALFSDRVTCESVSATMASRFPDVRFITTAINSTSELF